MLTDDYILIPKSELIKLEESRKQLFNFLDSQCNDLHFLSNLTSITHQMWIVANKKDWKI